MGALEKLRQLHRNVDAHAAEIAAHHSERLRCRRGCYACCCDDLTVFEIEAALIRRQHTALLASGSPHRPGGCAFLTEDGSCRIYDCRPYVCRTQGLPLRWLGDEGIEYRDICPLNEEGPALETLSVEACWWIGPFEDRLQRLQVELGGPCATRVRLRDLFRPD